MVRKGHHLQPQAQLGQVLVLEPVVVESRMVEYRVGPSSRSDFVRLRLDHRRSLLPV